MQHLVTVNTQFSFRHLQLPLHLFSCKDYADLSVNAKVVYALILNRIRLSQANNQANPGKWTEEDGSLFAIYPRSDLASDLNLSQASVIKCIKELIRCNLILEKRKGQGKANRIYLVENSFLHTVKQDDEMTPAPQDPAVPQDMQDPQESSETEAMFDNVPPTSDTQTNVNSPDLKNVNVLNSKIFNSGIADFSSLDFKNFEPNYINRLYTNPNDINSCITISKSVSYSQERLTAICDEVGNIMDKPIYGYDQHTKALVKNSLHYLYFLDSLTLGRATYPQDYVRDRLQDITIEIVDQAIERLSQNKNKVKNVLAYTAKTLFSCILESESFINTYAMYGNHSSPDEHNTSFDDELRNAVAEYERNQGDKIFDQEDSLQDAAEGDTSHGDNEERDTNKNTDEKATRQIFFEALGVCDRNPTYSENSLFSYAVSHEFEPAVMKTVVETTIADRGRFNTEYALSLLENWGKQGLHTLAQVQNVVTDNIGISEWEKEWLNDVIRYEQAKEEEIGDHGTAESINDSSEQKIEATAFNQEKSNNVLAQETMDLCPDSTVSSESENALPDYRCDPIKSEQIETEVTSEKHDIYSGKNDLEPPTEAATPVTGSIIQERSNNVLAQETMNLCPDSTVPSESENALPDYRCDPIKSEQIEAEVTPEKHDIYSGKNDLEPPTEAATPVTGSIIDEVINEIGLSRGVASVLCLCFPLNTPKETIFQTAVQWQDLGITTASEAMRYIHRTKEYEAISIKTDKVKMETICTALSMTA